jgi:type I restriction enzyme R subunit
MARLFDLTALRMQLALVEGEMGAFETSRQRVVEIAMLLEEKSAVPAVKAQLEYLASLQENSFWEGVSLGGPEEMRLRLRDLMAFLDKRKIVYTDFQDEVLGVREEEAVYMPKMSGMQYERKVKEFLEGHRDHLVIARLRGPCRPQPTEAGCASRCGVPRVHRCAR